MQGLPARGAFEERVLGFHHLAEFGVPIEGSVVLHCQTYRRFAIGADFIARNLPFAAPVSLMGSIWLDWSIKIWRNSGLIRTNIRASF
jgi:hypothetical protein